MAEASLTTKRCTKCGRTQPIENFGRQRQRKDGRNPWCRLCKKADHRNWYVKNRRAKLDQNQRWREENWDRFLELARARYRRNPGAHYLAVRRWIERNRGQYRAWSRADYRRHRAKRLRAMRRYRERNAAQIRAWRKVYVAANRELIAALKRAYKERLRNAPGRHTQDDIRRIYARQNGRCVYCPAPLKRGYSVDHIRALIRGGSNDPENLQLLCRRCNSRKHAKDEIEFAKEIALDS